jgi:SSS family solute:Na+ symporter
VFIMQSGELRALFFPAGYPPPETMPDGVQAVDDLYGMPLFLGRVLPAGLIGVITAGMVAAFMSTHDSYLLCWSSVLTQDVVAPLRDSMGRPLSSEARILLTRILIVVIGLYVLYWGLVYRGDDDIWDYMAVTGAIYFTGAFALLVGGLYWRRASSTGAFLALLAGLTAIVGLSPVQDGLGTLMTKLSSSAEPITVDIPSARVGLISIAATVMAMVIGSLLFPDRKPVAHHRAESES